MALEHSKRVLMVVMWDADAAQHPDLVLVHGHPDCGCSIYAVPEDKEISSLTHAVAGFTMNMRNAMAKHLMPEFAAQIYSIVQSFALNGVLGEYWYKPVPPTRLQNPVQQEEIKGTVPPQDPEQLTEEIQNLEEWMNKKGEQ